jgi:putative hydrolase of the HAD superfamily
LLPDKLHRVRVILFDAVGTVVYPDPPLVEAYAQMGRRFGIELGPAEIRRRFQRAFAEQDAQDRRRGNRTCEERERSRWRAVIDEVFCSHPQSGTIFAQLWDYFARPESWRCFDDVDDCFHRLRQRGLSIGVASNFDSRLRQVAAGVLPQHSDIPLAISSEIGWRKPAPEFFQSAARLVGGECCETLLVGDDLENDVRGGADAGLLAIWLNRAPDRTPAALGSLSELAEIFDSLPCAGARSLRGTFAPLEDSQT